MRIVTDTTETVWTPHEARRVLDALNHVMFNVEKFRGNTEDYYDLNNSFIDQVRLSKCGDVLLCLRGMDVLKLFWFLCQVLVNKSTAALPEDIMTRMVRNR